MTTSSVSVLMTATHVYSGCEVGTRRYAAFRSIVPCCMLRERRLRMPPRGAYAMRRANSLATVTGKSALQHVMRSCSVAALLALLDFPLSMQRHLPFCMTALRARHRHLPRP